MKTMIRKIAVIPAMLAMIASSQSLAQGDVDLENEDNRIAYSIGVNIGQNLASQGLLDGVDLDLFIVGMLDAVNGEAKLGDEEMFAALQLFQERLATQAQAAMEQAKAASEAFLRENTSKEGVVTLASGLQYLILESGDASGANPSASNSVLAHYHGTLIDGTVFDSSVDRGEPAQFGLSQVIAGWTEALQLMRPGDKWRLFLPSDLAYGEASPTPAIPPNSALIFDVELLEIY
jgi:FKBP-type peptidyl-prolyl cis-trans isomerase FklB